MDSLSQTIGKNIRELRHGKQMTQAQLSGGEITRNMLSLIESGNASPSINTLVYLAKQLDVPVGYFFTSDNAEATEYVKMEIIDNIRKLFSNHDYEKCVQLCRSTTLIDDEIAYIIAQSELKLAYAEIEKYRLVSAEEHFELALAASELTSYQPLSVSQSVDFYMHFISSATSDTLDQELTEPFRYAQAQIPAEMFIFFFRLRMLESGIAAAHEADRLITSPVLRDYLRAKEFIMKSDLFSAISLMKKIIQNPDVGFFIEYRACRDLEYCTNKMEDYKSAYAYAKRRAELTEKFQK